MMHNSLKPLRHIALQMQCQQAALNMTDIATFEESAQEISELRGAQCSCGQCPPLTELDMAAIRANMGMFAAAAEFKRSVDAWRAAVKAATPQS